MGRTAGAAELTIDKAASMSVEDLATRGVYVHRRLGEALEEVGHAPWITEQDKTAFLTSEYMLRTEVLHRQLLAYSQIGPRATLKQKDVQQNTPVDILGQRIKDLEMLLGENERRYKAELLQKQTTIEMLEKHVEQHKAKITEWETTYKELEAEHKEMEGWNTKHLNEIESLEEQLEDRKEVIQKLAALL